MKKNNNYWKEKLSEEQYSVLRESHTEPPFTGELLNNKKAGIYRCAACNTEIFSSNTKYDSGSGWPSFYDVLDSGKIKLVEDLSHGMQRTEIKCANCDSHLGHLFDDGPSEKTGLRYCVNSAALGFEEKNSD